MEVARKTRPLKPGKADFAVARLLGRIVKGKALLNLPKGAKLFHQGEAADAIYFRRRGRFGSCRVEAGRAGSARDDGSP